MIRPIETEGGSYSDQLLGRLSRRQVAGISSAGGRSLSGRSLGGRSLDGVNDCIRNRLNDLFRGCSGSYQ